MSGGPANLARSVHERISMAVVVAGLTVVWSGIAWAAIRHLIAP
jgi:hypothetical protein